VTAGASAAERVRPGTRWVLLAVGFLWVYNGVNFLAFKVGVDALPAAFLAATRFTVAGIVLLPLAVWRVLADERPDAPSLLTAALLGIVMLVGGQALVIWGVSYLPAGEASVFGSTPPLYLALFAWFVFRQPLDRRKLLGVCVGFLGTALLGWSSASGGSFSPKGAAASVRDGVLGRGIAGRDPGYAAARPGLQPRSAACDCRLVADHVVLAHRRGRKRSAGGCSGSCLGGAGVPDHRQHIARLRRIQLG